MNEHLVADGGQVLVIPYSTVFVEEGEALLFEKFLFEVVVGTAVFDDCEEG